METWDAIRARRNVRDFADRPVSTEDVDRVLEAGRRAPSSRNWQPWDFVVVTDRERLTNLSKVWHGAWHVANSAATVALIAPVVGDERQRDWAQFDLGQAAMSIMIAAADLGVGTAHAAVEDQKLARSILGFPDSKFCACLIAMGYPDDRPLEPIERPNRRPFEDVVHRGRW
jgi:nitroreductase